MFAEAPRGQDVASWGRAGTRSGSAAKIAESWVEPVVVVFPSLRRAGKYARYAGAERIEAVQVATELAWRFTLWGLLLFFKPMRSGGGVNVSVLRR